MCVWYAYVGVVCVCVRGVCVVCLYMCVFMGARVVCIYDVCVMCVCGVVCVHVCVYMCYVCMWCDCVFICVCKCRLEVNLGFPSPGTDLVFSLLL